VVSAIDGLIINLALVWSDTCLILFKDHGILYLSWPYQK